jgi:Secretion system C-terminal sorting domain
MRPFCVAAVVCFVFSLKAPAQVNFNAQGAGAVPVYTSDFLYGSNMGYYPPWTNQTIADIAAGNPAKNVKGAGVKSLHLPLPEDFLQTWGYDVSVNDFIHYNSLGIKDNTVFLETPTAAHRDNTTYPGCNTQSLIWANIYEPIWDGGVNGTPVNENNYLAAYIYNTVTRYKQWVKFWELVNEPDFDNSASGWKARGVAGNWWEQNPQACDLLNLRAPIYSYIRMMHIAYEVVKTIDPSAYVSMGGVGYPSFLDAMLRNTENPVDGSVTAQYPVTGGAWFDCISFHYYPMYDMRYFDFTAGVWKFKRYSDSGIEEFVKRKLVLDSVLATRGYDNSVYPAKVFINTENNIPRKAFGDFPGGDEIQRNYDMKVLVASQLHGVRQYYTFSIGDTKLYDAATQPFDVVGLYQPLNGIGPTATDPTYRQQYNSAGIAYKTMSDLLGGFTVDQQRTSLMNMPASISGAAFKNAIGDYRYVLWAKTSIDNSEAAGAVYAFPPAINMPALVYQRSWDYMQTNASPLVSSQSIALTGTPSIISAPLVVTALHPDSVRNNPGVDFSFTLYPNPVRDKLTIRLHLNRRIPVSIVITDNRGQVLTRVANNNTMYTTGDNYINTTLPAGLPAGIYYCRMTAGGNRDQVIKFVVAK